MPRVTRVKSAQKDNPVCKAGEPYFWWKFRHGGKRYSLTYPKPSQLTQSAYYQSLYGLQEYLDAQEPPENEDDFEMLRDEATSQMQEIADTCQESRDNMPESLQDAPTGELLQERIDACENAISEMENVEYPEGWADYRTWVDDHDEWEMNEPNEDMFLEDADNDQTAAEQFEAAHDEWEAEEPDEVEEPEAFDMSELISPIDDCHV